MIFPDNLTIEEQAEFTAVNLIAFNVAREHAGETRIPAWLCTSDEAKQASRKAAANWYNSMQRPLIPVNVDNEYDLRLFEKILNKGPAQSMMQQWIDGEADLKRHREEGNPQAYFAPNAKGE